MIVVRDRRAGHLTGRSRRDHGEVIPRLNELIVPTSTAARLPPSLANGTRSPPSVVVLSPAIPSSAYGPRGGAKTLTMSCTTPEREDGEDPGWELGGGWAVGVSATKVGIYEPRTGRRLAVLDLPPRKANKPEFAPACWQMALAPVGDWLALIWRRAVLQGAGGTEPQDPGEDAVHIAEAASSVDCVTGEHGCQLEYFAELWNVKGPPRRVWQARLERTIPDQGLAEAATPTGALAFDPSGTRLFIGFDDGEIRTVSTAAPGVQAWSACTAPRFATSRSIRAGRGRSPPTPQASSASGGWPRRFSVGPLTRMLVPPATQLLRIRKNSPSSGDSAVGAGTIAALLEFVAGHVAEKPVVIERFGGRRPVAVAKPHTGGVVKRFFLTLGHELLNDNITDNGAMMAYYAILSLFPMLVFVIALALVVLPEATVLQGLGMATRALPEASREVLTTQVTSLMRAAHAGFAITGAALALWGASRGASSLMGALNAMFNQRETRPWWKRQLVAISVTLGVAGLIVVALALLVVGLAAGHWLADRFGLGGAFDVAWNIGRWLCAGLLVLFVWAVIYKFLPNTKAPFRLFTPGAVVGVVLWLAISSGFGVYISHFNSYTATYGALGGAIIFLTWLWLSSMALLFGAEINDVVGQLRTGRHIGNNAIEAEPDETRPAGEG